MFWRCPPLGEMVRLTTSHSSGTSLPLRNATTGLDNVERQVQKHFCTCIRLRNAQNCLKAIGQSEVILASQVPISLGTLLWKMGNIYTIASGHSYLQKTMAVVSTNDRMPIYKTPILPLQFGDRRSLICLAHCSNPFTKPHRIWTQDLLTCRSVADAGGLQHAQQEAYHRKQY